MINDILERLMKNQDNSKSKSYFIGLERGRIWAENYADYFDMRQLAELNSQEVSDLVIPTEEERHFHIINSETPLEWTAYLKGWLEGVKEINQRY